MLVPTTLYFRFTDQHKQESVPAKAKGGIREYMRSYSQKRSRTTTKEKRKKATHDRATGRRLFSGNDVRKHAKPLTTTGKFPWLKDASSNAARWDYYLINAVFGVPRLPHSVFIGTDQYLHSFAALRSSLTQNVCKLLTRFGPTDAKRQPLLLNIFPAHRQFRQVSLLMRFVAILFEFLPFGKSSAGIDCDVLFISISVASPFYISWLACFL